MRRRSSAFDPLVFECLRRREGSPGHRLCVLPLGGGAHQLSGLWWAGGGLAMGWPCAWAARGLRVGCACGGLWLCFGGLWCARGVRTGGT
eukprot:5171003-Prymnesium_polylepis.1